MKLFRFALLMMKRNHQDPLYVFWCCTLTTQKPHAWFDAGKISSDERDDLLRHLFYVTNCGAPNLTMNLLLGYTQKRFTHEPCSSSDLWNVTNKKTDSAAHIATYTLSKLFVKKQASWAFLYMYSMGTGRDVARLIARMVVRLYLDDYKWIQDISMNKNWNIRKLTRERLMNWVPRSD